MEVPIDPSTFPTGEIGPSFGSRPPPTQQYLAPRVRKKLGLFRAAHVEGLPQGDAWGVLWASDVLAAEGADAYPCVPTESATLEPRGCGELREEDDEWHTLDAEEQEGLRVLGGQGDGGGSFVFQGDQFEVKVVGFSAAAFDFGMGAFKGKSEVVLTSTVKGGKGGGRGPNAPKVHFDFRTDHTTVPDEYQPVPDGRSLATRCCGTEGRTGVNVNFLIMEIDHVSDETRATIDCVADLSGKLQEIAVTMPYVAALSPLLDIASDLGGKALKAYAKPDRVIGTDMDFKILRRGDASTQRSGDYLRYGYYFFLSKPMNIKLYAATRGSKNVRLLMRDERGKYVKLTHVSYVVVKVVVPQQELVEAHRPVLSLGTAMQLQRVIENVDVMGAEEVRDEIMNLVQPLSAQTCLSADDDVCQTKY